MSSSKSFNFTGTSSESPKTPTGRNETHSLFATPGSDKGERLLFSSPSATWGSSPSMAQTYFSSPSNMISPQSATSGIMFDNPGHHGTASLVSPRNYMHFHPQMDNADPHSQFHSTSHGASSGYPFAGGMMSQQAQGHFDAAHFHPLTDDREALDSTSSNRPLKRQRLDIMPMSNHIPVQNHQTQIHAMMQPQMWAQSGNAGHFSPQNFGISSEPKARRRLDFSPQNPALAGAPSYTQPGDLSSSIPAKYSENLPVGEMKITAIGKAPEELDQPEKVKMPPKKPRRKKKRKRKGHTIVDDVTGMKTGTWTDDEHERFLEALKLHKKGNWRDISRHVRTRTRVQCASHAQKYEIRLQREKEEEEEEND